jgi:pimeloyl-ACP methyl ester carboxylesterase
MFFGAEDRARFGYLGWPDGPVRGAAVVCPPLGYDDTCAHTALRHLAEQLTDHGVVTLRIDYDGTGNSVGSDLDDDRVAAWTQSVVDAATELRRWGLPQIILIGLRFGATLAVQAAARLGDGVEALALWDPVVSGRRYVRTMRLFANSGGYEASSDDGLCVAGVEFTARTLAEMSKVQIDAAQLRVPCLVVVRAEAESEARDLVEEAASGNVEARTLDGTSALIDTDAELARIPHKILDEIASWVQKRSAVALDPQPVRPRLRDQAVEVFDGVELSHRALRLGSGQLFAIDTGRVDADAESAVVMLNNGLARSIGPGRAWVELGEALAGDGLRVLRVDLSGLGDSPVRPGHAENDSYSFAIPGDIGEVIAHLHDEGVRRVVLLGLCSGAYVGFDAALDHPDIDALVCINGRYDKPFNDRRRDRPHRAAGQTNRFLKPPLNKSPLLPFFQKVPTWIWWLLGRLHLVARPTDAIEKGLERNVRVFLIFGEEEWGLRALRRRGGKRFNEVLESPLTALVEVPGLDHSMFDPSGRARVKALVRSYVAGLGTPRSSVVLDAMNGSMG